MSLEVSVAHRWLRRPTALTFGLHVMTLALGLIAGGARVLMWWGARHRPEFAPVSPWQAQLPWIVMGAIALAVIIGFLLVLLQFFTVFSALTTFALFLGAAFPVVVLSVMAGFEQDLQQKILGANAHILVTTPDRSFTDYREAGPRIRAIAGDRVTPYITNEVMISSQSNLSGVVLKGIDPASAGKVTDLAKNLEQGRLEYLTHPEELRVLGGAPTYEDDEAGDRDGAPPDGKHHVEFHAVDAHGNPVIPPEPPSPHRRIAPGLIIGKELAKNLRLYVGDDVNVIAPMGDIGPAGPMPKSRAFRVAGIFYSGMYEYDTKYVYMSIPDAQKFLGLDDEVTGFEIRIADPDKTGPVVDKLRATLGAGYDVQDWKELNRNLFAALKVERVTMFIILLFVVLVAGFSIVANGIMLVREKRREIAILKSMGATDGAILRSFFYMGVHMAGVGLVCGILAGIGGCLMVANFGVSLDTDVYYISRLPVKMNALDIGAIFAAALAIVLAFTLYPALVAARMRPVDGLRYEMN